MILTVLDAIKAQLLARITAGGKTIGVYILGGGERAGETERKAKENILVGITGWRPTQSNKSGGIQYEVGFIAWCYSSNKTADSVRTLVAANLAAQLTKLLENNNWGLSADGVSKPTFGSARDTTTLLIAQGGMARYEVTWWQEMPLVDADIDKIDALYNLDEVDVDTDLEGSLDNTPEMQATVTNLYND